MYCCKVDTIFNFWFGKQQKGLINEQTQLWWGKDPTVDKYITDHFKQDVINAIAGDYNDWLAEPKSNLVLIILGDQFSRHIYRDTPAAYDADSLTLRWAEKGISCGNDKQLTLFERTFFYMPFQHAEEIEAQEKSVDLFYNLYQQAPVEYRQLFKNYYIYAVRHKNIIERFGRFPHRNDILNRPSSETERNFMSEPKSRF